MLLRCSRRRPSPHSCRHPQMRLSETVVPSHRRPPCEDLKTNSLPATALTHRYGLGIRFLRQEYAVSYAKLDLPSPLPVGGDPDTELSTGPQAGLPIYSSTPSSPEKRMEALQDRGGAKCALCAESFRAGENLMLCYHCGAAAHVRCLACRMLREAGGGDSESEAEREGEVIPSEGLCWAPACARRLLWSRLVKGAQPYRPRASSSGSALEGEAGGGDGRSGGTAVGDGPLVWRVDDSSGDEDDEEGGGAGDEDSDCDSERAVVREDRGGWSSGAASRDLVSATDREGKEEEDDDDDDDDGFWDLGGGCSQGRRGGGVLGESGKERRIAPYGGSGRGRKTSAPLATAGRPQQSERSRDGRHVSLVDTASDRHDSDGNSSSGSGGGRDRGAERSPPRLPLAERLRLKRLGGS